MIDSSGYAALLVLHVIGFTAAFGPALIYPALLRSSVSAGKAGAHTATLAANLQRKVAMPALLFTVIMGFALTAASGGVYSAGDSWISASMSIVLALAVLSYFVLAPALAKLAIALKAGTETDSAVKAIRIGTAIYLLGFVIIVYLMSAKP